MDFNSHVNLLSSFSSDNKTQNTTRFLMEEFLPPPTHSILQATNVTYENFHYKEIKNKKKRGSQRIPLNPKCQASIPLIINTGSFKLLQLVPFSM